MVVNGEGGVMSKVDCFYTLKYKGAFIHMKSVDNVERATVQIFNGSDFFTKECKSFRAAQIFITKWMRGVK
jgi:hypothetical protein